MNFIHLVKHGYKMSLSLNTNSEIDEPWNANVGQKILSVYFSTLSLRSEYWPDDVKLDGFESLLMDEAYAAFKGQRYLNLFALNNDRMRACPDKLISICNEIKGYRKILTSDKITLLFNMYYHLHTMDGVINYDSTIDGWDYPASDYKFDRRDTFIFNRSFHDGLNYVIETFPDRFRNDINVIILIYLIVIFNGDTTGLKCPEMIRHEQFSYIYLLRRYLRTVCESDCEASDNHYRLMVKIEHVRLLTEKTKNKFLRLLHEPLLETITKAITLGVPKRMPQMFQAPHLKT
ncbi:nuclear hormone receptor HR96-like isoform X1 [Tetranychus urticae]|nr:nuclear hormone receptor HR96-like isoform X1 [Tetranychus urticae]